jgi:thioredoxin-related protein
MNKIVIGILLFFVTTGVLAEEKKEAPLPDTYVQALQYAKNKNKRIFLFFKSKSCGWCSKMEQDTLSDHDIQTAMIKRDICLRYTVIADNDQDTTRKYNVRSFPAYWIIDYKEKKFNSGVGYRSPKVFLQWLDEKK